MIRPNLVDLKGDSFTIANFVRTNGGEYYAEMVPVAKSDGSNLKEIGAIICNNPSLQNIFINTLFNKVALSLIKSKSYENPWRRFKKGILEYGETIEEIFVDICKPHHYDVDVATQKVWAIENPDVKTNFLLVNYETFYKQSTEDDELSKAFLTRDGLVRLVYKIIDAMYKSMNFDEFLIMKYCLIKMIIDGNIKTVQIPSVTADNMEAIAAVLQAYSDKFTFLKRDYNIAGVANTAEKTSQHLIVTPEFNGIMNVKVLAHAFNMEKAEVQARTTLIDSFSEFTDEEIERLKVLCNDANVDFDSSVITELEKIESILLDEDFIQVWDKLLKFKEMPNGEGLYWNHWLHNWKIVGVSAFANCVAFVTGTPGVTSVTVTPGTANLLPGQSLQLTATVVTSLFAPQGVVWSVPENSGATISQLGKITIDSDATAGDITVTATSKYDSTVTGTATITVVVPS
jgi:hypothetical protein